MKKVMQSLGILSLIALLFISCSKTDDPADNDLFVGTYRGSISYHDADETKSNDNGSITVAKFGDSYNFAFSDGIPDITGIKFKEEGDNVYINIGGDATNYIRINSSTLKILYMKDGRNWAADCDR